MEPNFLLFRKTLYLNCAYFPIVFDEYKYTRNKIFEKSWLKLVLAIGSIFPHMNSFECYINSPTAEIKKAQIAQHMALRILIVSLYANLVLEDVDRICNIILGG